MRKMIKAEEELTLNKILVKWFLVKSDRMDQEDTPLNLYIFAVNGIPKINTNMYFVSAEPVIHFKMGINGKDVTTEPSYPHSKGEDYVWMSPVIIRTTKNEILNDRLYINITNNDAEMTITSISLADFLAVKTGVAKIPCKIPHTLISVQLDLIVHVLLSPTPVPDLEKNDPSVYDELYRQYQKVASTMK